MKRLHNSELGDLAVPDAPQFVGRCDLEGFTSEQLLEFLRKMLLIRYAEEQIALWVEQGRARCPCHLGIGQEGIAAGVAAGLRPTDRLFGNHRSHGHYLAAGGGVYPLLAEVLGRSDGCARGMGGSMHLYGAECGFQGSVPIVAGTIPIAVGAALAAKMSGSDDIAVAFFGDGACEEGILHESLNFAASYALPVVFVCENNQYASHLDVTLRQPSDLMGRFANAHRVPSVLVDGNDVACVARAACTLIGRARKISEPQFLEAVTYRWRGHVGPKEDLDVGVRRSMSDLAAWKGRDPVRRLLDALLESRIATPSQLDVLRREVRETVADAADRALNAPLPAERNLLDFVYAP